MSTPGPIIDMNVDEAERALMALIDDFGFDTTVEGKSVAEDASDALAIGIEIMVNEGKCLDGTQMEPNEPKYSRRKGRQYGWEETGYKTGQMLSKVSLKGKMEVTKDLVTIHHGLDTPPTRGVSPTGRLDDQDRKVTDRQKAQWFTDGFAGVVTYTTKAGKQVSYERHQPPRPFFGADAETEDLIAETIQDDLYHYIGAAWGT